ncbi:MAG: bifunctional riboflavin kinase/FAD synthetase [Flavobacterium sp.]|nr:MAG: bifunctional riboflavin kinase/FAD synthetase [Flavobacterium sp.]
MKIFNSIADFTPKRQTVVTIGTFDGVHIGHRKIVERLIQSAQSENCDSLLLTFSIHPRMVLESAAAVSLLTTTDEKEELLSHTFLDFLVVHPFDEKFSDLSPRDFVKKILVDSFNVRKIIIGHDHRFGKNRMAGYADLVDYGEEFGFSVEQIPAQEVADVSVSSTRIRKAISEGRIELANSYLGYNYLLSGIVVEGQRLGRTIGFPTANIAVTDPSKLIPANGVYVVEWRYGNQVVNGMLNIGFRPTVGGKTLSVEVHFFNLDKDLYGQNITLGIIARLRDERRFDGIDSLKLQLEADRNTALTLLNDC